MDALLDYRQLRREVARLPEIEGWPQIMEVFDRAGDAPRPDWELPLRACLAVGGDLHQAIPAAAAIACLQVSIILLDDILDNDPRGAHLHLGVGEAANLAMALQAAALRIALGATLPDKDRADLAAILTEMVMRTAFGQKLDVQNLQGETAYWRVVDTKSTPFYGAALKVGAICGGASSEVAQALHSVGVIIGQIIQLEDDLHDAFQTPANADWLQGRNNLLLLFAKKVEHPNRQAFEQLLFGVSDVAVLSRAQEILVQCGAVSYVAYQLGERYRQARMLLLGMHLEDPDPLTSVFDQYEAQLVALWSAGGKQVTAAQLRSLFSAR